MSAIHDLLDEACWEYVVRYREQEDAWGAMRQAQAEIDRLIAEFRAALEGRDVAPVK